MGAIRTTEELLRSLLRRVQLLERRLSVRGATPSSRLAMTGEMKMWPLAVAPDGWVFAQGQAISRADHSDLFALYGTTFGAGDGATTFNVIDMRGRVPTGLDSTQTEFDAIGEAGGSKTHTLTVAQMPTHKHDHDQARGGNLSYSEGGGVTAYTAGFGSGRINTGIVTGTAGGGQAHPILQPYRVVNFIIKT